ncbi:MAG: hydrogenase maturation protease, partial [Acidobacteriota bacterium]
LQQSAVPEDVECLDGGTGSFQLLGPLQQAERVILIDATADGEPPGTLKRLRPRFSKDYPPTLTAHDIGLKDLLDAFYLLGGPPEVTLFTVSISLPQPMSTELSDAVASRVGDIARRVREEISATGAHSE